MITGAEFIEAIPIILSLIVIEGLLSVDNALAIAALAGHLPRNQQKLALRLGIIGAYAFRGICLVFVAWIQGNLWLKYLGAGYLIYLMCSHLTTREEHIDPAKLPRPRGLWTTVATIELMDLSLSIDNVIAAVALSDKLWIIITGVFIGILALRVLAGYAIGLIVKFPVLGKTAFLLVGYVGFLLLYEMLTQHPIGTLEKFFGICLILLVTLLYERSQILQKIFQPLVRFGLLLMRAVVGLVGVIAFPVTFLIGKFRPHSV